MSESMNRRAFFGGLFAILPAATCYRRIWKEIAKTEMRHECLIKIGFSVNESEQIWKYIQYIEREAGSLIAIPFDLFSYTKTEATV